jgi:hypothetical protein
VTVEPARPSNPLALRPIRSVVNAMIVAAREVGRADRALSQRYRRQRPFDPSLFFPSVEFPVGPVR